MTAIIIIDDEMPIRNSLAEFLKDYDYDVATAESGESALAMLEEMPFHVAIVDLRLPGMSGENFILQARRINPELRYLIHTGSVDYMLSPELMAQGITGFHLISKPVDDLSRLIEKVEALINVP